MDEDRAEALGLTIRRFLVSFKRMVQVTRIGDERVEAEKIRGKLAAVWKCKKEIWCSKTKKRFFRIDISFSFYCITNTLKHSSLKK